MSDRETFENAMLGLLFEEPRHGYDLSERFTEGGELGSVLELGRSNVYSLLQALECRGDVERRLAPGHGGPMKAVFGLTEPGRRRFLCWLGSPVDSVRDLRIQFVLKAYFHDRLGLSGLEELTRGQLGVVRARLDELERRAASAMGAEALVLGLQAKLVRAGIAWLENLADGAQPAAACASGPKESL